MAGLTKNTPAHFGGTFDKDTNGELNGRVTDVARDIFKGVGKMVTYSPAEQLNAVRSVASHSCPRSSSNMA